MGSMLAGGVAGAAAAYGAHHLAHGAYHHMPHMGYYGHGHGKFKHGKFGKRWKHGGKFGGFKKWK